MLSAKKRSDRRLRALTLYSSGKRRGNNRAQHSAPDWLNLLTDFRHHFHVGLGDLTLFPPGIFVLNQAGIFVHFRFTFADDGPPVVGLNSIVTGTARQQG